MDEASSRARQSLRLPRGRYFRILSGVAFGRGLRLNNPYRLQTELGDDARSFSLTATYLDLSAAIALGAPDGVQHGVTLHGSIALDGIAQEVITPAYLVVYQPAPRWLVSGRAGLPVILEPDANVGFEVAARGGMLLTGSLGVAADVVADLFYGAATLDTGRSAIPVVSVQLGAFYQYEGLP